MTTIKLKPRDPEAAYRRAAKAQRKVGVGARCACGETRPLALIPGSAPIICAKCKREQRGASVMDNHHPFGVSNDAYTTVPIPVNVTRNIVIRHSIWRQYRAYAQFIAIAV